MKYNKLVRDKIIEIIELNGEKPVSRILNDDEYRDELVKKLKEECQELLEAIEKNNRDEIVEESADLMEVICSINKLQESNFDDIIKVMKEKREKRGGFDKKIFLEKVQ